MSPAAFCLRLLLMLSLALGGATPGMAAAGMLDMASETLQDAPAGTAHGAQCHHAHGAAEATHSHARGVMHSPVAATAHADHAGIAEAGAKHAPHQGDAGCNCCDAGTCDCACMHGVPCVAIDVANLLSDVPAGSSVDATLADAHPEPARAQLIRPPTHQTA